MATHQLHTIQHFVPSLLLLLLLLQFSSLYFLSHGYTFPDKYFINCGSNNNVTDSRKVYVGESNSYPLTKFSSKRSYTECNQSSSAPYSPLYQTARIFRRQKSWYEFQIDTVGTYLVRLHFLAFSSPTNLSSATFRVSVPGFMLLQNFEAKSYTDSALVKEFFMNITIGSFRISFNPLPSSFAFVNAIELFTLPRYLIADVVYHFNGTLSSYSGALSRVLETKHRLNVGGLNVTRNNDPLLRSWIPDDAYLVNPENAKTSSPYNGSIMSQVSDDSDGPNATRYTAPIAVYGTAKESGNPNVNITWGLPVDKNTDHLIRVHFCDIWNTHVSLTFFNLYINDQVALFINNDTNVSSQLPAPYYYDLVVQSDDSAFMKISIEPDFSAPNPKAFLNGLEIMKMINSSDFGSLVNLSNGRHNHLHVVLGSILGGLVLVLVFCMGFGFVWHLKIRKQKTVPTTSRGSSHKTNLGLKIALHDLQSATNDFDEERIIGQGGFGNVYKGVLKNGMRVAVKRSRPGSSCQGLSEFHTEIMVCQRSVTGTSFP